MWVGSLFPSMINCHVTSRFWAHLVMSYVFSYWTCYVLYHEYKRIASMRLRFLASENRRPDQFTVRSSWLCPCHVFLWIFILIKKLDSSLFFTVLLWWFQGSCEERSPRSRWINQWACRTFLLCKSSRTLSFASSTLSLYQVLQQTIIVLSLTAICFSVSWCFMRNYFFMFFNL